jgi:hypothetical protein
VSRSISLVTGTPACRARDRRHRQLAPLEREPLVAIPQDDPLPLVLGEEDHGERVRRIADGGVGRVDRAPCQLVANPAGVVVGTEGADVLGAETEGRAGRQGGRHLTAAANRVARHPHLGVGAFRLGIGGEPVDVVDRVGADADDVDAGCGGHDPKYIGSGPLQMA